MRATAANDRLARERHAVQVALEAVSSATLDADAASTEHLAAPTADTYLQLLAAADEVIARLTEGIEATDAFVTAADAAGVLRRPERRGILESRAKLTRQLDNMRHLRLTG